VADGGWRQGGGAHSRVVAVLRIGLPLAALGLLSTLFLFSDRPRNGALPFGEAEVRALLAEPRMTAPAFAGVTEDGADLRLTAESLRLDMAGGGAEAARPVLAMTTADGVTWRAEAAEARLDPQRRLLVLSGGVAIASSDGWRGEAAAIAAALDRTHAETVGGPVRVTGPAGRIDAGRMRVERGTGGDVLVFKDGVKLLYAPSS
jgi:lipopolysaccharide export system protein LptC